jgi:hypothetical protein
MKMKSEDYFKKIVTQLGDRKMTFRKFGFKKSEIENSILLRQVMRRLA